MSLSKMMMPTRTHAGVTRRRQTQVHNGRWMDQRWGGAKREWERERIVRSRCLGNSMRSTVVCAAASSRKKGKGKRDKGPGTGAGAVEDATVVLEKELAAVQRLLEDCAASVDKAARSVENLEESMEERVGMLEERLGAMERSVEQAGKRSGHAPSPEATPEASASVRGGRSSQASTGSAGDHMKSGNWGAGAVLVASAFNEITGMVQMETRVEDRSLESTHDAVDVNVVHKEDDRQQRETDEARRTLSSAGGAPASHEYPQICRGSDDIEGIARLHRLLTSHGFCVSDEEEEDFMFEETTEEALRTYQTCNGLDETGFADEATWRALHGEQTVPKTPAVSESKSAQQRKRRDNILPESPTSPPADPVATGDSVRAEGVAPSSPEQKWPALEHGIGGRDVHLLQRALAVRSRSCIWYCSWETNE